MKTEELIRALAADSVRPITPIGRSLLAALVGGTALAVAVFGMTLHARPDLSMAIRTPAFVYKLIIAASLAVSAAYLLPELARPLPGRSRNHCPILILAPVLLTVGVGIELYVQPPSLWLPRLVGRNALHCLSLIPFLAAAPATCLFIALRRGAPAQPKLAGAVAGLAAGGLGAVLYALTCPDDSPLFVATWYSIAVAAVTGLCAYAGQRLLRW
jgi:hypothetical protein